MAHEIKLGVQLDSSKAKSEFESLVKQLSNNKNLKLKIDFDSKNFNLSNITKELNVLSNKMKNGLHLKINNDSSNTIKNMINEVEGLGASIKNFNKDFPREVDYTSIWNQSSQALKDYRKEYEKTQKLQQKINSFKESETNSLNKLKNNGIIDSSVINSLQNRLNNINTDNAEKEIKELQNTIKNLGSSESSIVRLQNQITKMESNLGNMKGKFGEGFINNKASEEIRQYESEINKLKSTSGAIPSSVMAKARIYPAASPTKNGILFKIPLPL